ncbi:unnamed protein product [Meloidogyne enterolobii]|uniref:Uncharacterized protein n=1 Tax=Meloidogyne enterolobii TaxID=390850 RepID=A0ACB0ZZQ8_MELEN
MVLCENSVPNWRFQYPCIEFFDLLKAGPGTESGLFSLFLPCFLPLWLLPFINFNEFEFLIMNGRI